MSETKNSGFDHLSVLEHMDVEISPVNATVCQEPCLVFLILELKRGLPAQVDTTTQESQIRIPGGF